MQVQQLTQEETFNMYMKCEKEDLAKMLAEANRMIEHLIKPKVEVSQGQFPHFKKFSLNPSSQESVAGTSTKGYEMRMSPPTTAGTENKGFVISKTGGELAVYVNGVKYVPEVLVPEQESKTDHDKVVAMTEELDKYLKSKQETCPTCKGDKRATVDNYCSNSWHLKGEQESQEEIWISVDNQIPESMQHVLCYNGRMKEDYYCDHTDQDKMWFIRTYSHWRILPQSPKK